MCCCTVILAPYGLAATVSGRSYKDTDAASQQALHEWQQFYVLSPQPPIPPSMGPTHSQRCAKVVEVLVGKYIRYIKE